MGDQSKDRTEPADFATTIEASVRLPSSRHGSRYAPRERVGDFIIESFIAEGGFGSVYRAAHERLGTVALKIAHIPAAYLSTDALALQQNELEALMQLRHPSLVRVLGHGVLEDRRNYLALELVEGESLRRYMDRRGRVDVLEAVALVRRLAEAIAHCHQANTFHLDLTPTNIIVADAYAPEIKIVDFGVAAFAQHWFDIERRPAAGTPRYIAPELLRESPQIGSHCDVYALGLILYELLAGCFPFVGSTAQQILEKKLSGEAIPLAEHAPDGPAEIADTVHALIHPEPAQRGFSAASLGAHLRTLYFEVLRRDRDGGLARRRSRRKSDEIDTPVAPFVGREGELRRLVDDAEAVLRAPGAAAPPGPPAPPRRWAVVISGDPGIGKSRLAAELTHTLQAQRVAVGYGRCREHGSLISYASWRECLGQLERVVARTTHPGGEAARRALADLLADPTATDLCMLVPALERARIGAGAAPAELSMPDLGSRRVSQAVRRLVTAVCEHLPVALVLEDLHWADQGTLDILGALVSLPPPPRLVILCTARPEADLPAWPGLSYLRLKPLDEAQSAALLGALCGAASSAVIAQLTAAIPLLRLGNPLVDTQVILHLRREELLAEDADGRMVLAERFGRDYEPPTTIASVLERRLRHVPPRARDILGIASLIGRQFHASDLERIAGAEIDPREVGEAVRGAVALTLCRADGDECTFVHDVIRDHLETTVGEARRPALHARIALVLRERGAPAATLAYHLDRAGDWAAAAAKYFDGGLEADRVHDLVGSSHALRRAVALYLELPPSPGRDRALARTAYELARITCLLGKTHQPLEDLDRCRAAMAAPPDDARVMLHSAYARVYYAQGDFLQAMHHSEQSLAVVDPALDSYQCAPANMLGRALCASGHFGPSIDLLLRGCQLARESGDLCELAHSEGLLGTSLAFTGQLAEGRRHIEESSRLAELLKNPARRMGVCLYRTLHAEAAYAWEDGIQSSARLLAHAEEYEMAGLYLYLGTLMAGRHHFHIGEPQRARHLLRNAINFSTLFGIRISRSWAHAYLGDVHLIEGHHEEALRLYELGLEIAREGRGDGFGLPLSLIGVAHASACLGRERARVIELAEQAFAAFEAAANRTSLAVGLVRYLDALARYGAADAGPGAGPGPRLLPRSQPRSQRDAAAEAARARLASVLARVGADRCEFWPQVPAGATAADREGPPAEFWARRAKIAPPAVERSDDRPADRPEDQAGPAVPLLFNLSTIDDFVPAFAARALP